MLEQIMDLIPLPKTCSMVFKLKTKTLAHKVSINNKTNK